MNLVNAVEETSAFVDNLMATKAAHLEQTGTKFSPNTAT